MRIIILIGNSVIGKYVASEFNKKINTLATIIEDRKENKFSKLLNKLKKNIFLMPYKLIEVLLLSFENRIITRKINNYFLRYKINLKNGIVVENINSNKTKDIIKSLEPDLGIVIGTSIIKNDTLDLFPKGLINMHTGILPNYKGLRSEFWALYNKDYGNIGVTIHEVNKEIDSGKILIQDKLKYNGEGEFKLRCKNVELGAKLLIKTIKNISKLKPIKQEKGNYYSNPNLFDLLKLRL